MVGEWLNTEKINDENVIKPCHRLGWCPYGPLIEEFRLRDENERNKFSCETSNSKKKQGSDEEIIDVEIEGLEDYVGKGDLDMEF